MSTEKTTPEPKDDYCGTAYAAKFLGLSVGTVQTLVEKDELRAWKTRGGHRRISMESLLDYQQRNNVNPTSSTSGKERLKVLVVDDDATTRELLQAAFTAWDLPIDFTVMDSALEALIEISSIQPDVLITDLRMPGVDGFELLRTLRNNPAFDKTHLLAISGLDPDQVKAHGGLPARTIYKHKPIEMNWLNGYLLALLTQST